MMSYEILKLTEKAIEKNELKDLFLGKPGYEFGNLKHIPANVATDISAILAQGLYVLYENGNKDVPEKLKTVVYELLDGTPVEIWTAYSIMWNQNWDKQHTEAAFYVIDSELSETARKSISNNRKDLISCKELVGCNLKDGLWEDIARLEKNLKNKYGAGLI